MASLGHGAVGSPWSVGGGAFRRGNRVIPSGQGTSMQERRVVGEDSVRGKWADACPEGTGNPCGG